MKVLLIDDEEAILDVFKQALEQANFTVITAVTGAQGLDLTRTEHPDVIFLDQVLPDINGNQVLQQLKADPETKAIPIAILSNFSQDTLVQNAMKMGATDYILKYQIAPQDLVNKANALMQDVQTPKPTAPQPPMPGTQGAPAPQQSTPEPQAPAPSTSQPVPTAPQTPMPSAPVAQAPTSQPNQPVQNPVNPTQEVKKEGVQN